MNAGSRLSMWIGGHKSNNENMKRQNSKFGRGRMSNVSFRDSRMPSRISSVQSYGANRTSRMNSRLIGRQSRMQSNAGFSNASIPSTCTIPANKMLSMDSLAVTGKPGTEYEPSFQASDSGDEKVETLTVPRKSFKLTTLKLGSALRVISKMKSMVKDAKDRARKKYLNNQKRKCKRMAFLVLLISVVIPMIITLFANITYSVSKKVVSGKYDLYNSIADAYMFGPGFHIMNIMFQEGSFHMLIEFGLVKFPIIALIGLIIYKLGLGRSGGVAPKFMESAKITGFLWGYLFVYNVIYMLTWRSRIDDFRFCELKGDIAEIEELESLGRNSVWFFGLERSAAQVSKPWTLLLSWDLHLVLLSAFIQLWAHRIITDLEHKVELKAKQHGTDEDKKDVESDGKADEFEDNLPEVPQSKMLNQLKSLDMEDDLEMQDSVELDEPLLSRATLIDPDRNYGSSSSGYDVVIDIPKEVSM